MKKIGIIGSRRRHNSKALEACRKTFLDIYEKGDIIVSGGCKMGGDAFAEIFAKDYGIEIIIHYAEWKKYGKSAGFQRNGLIARDSDIVIAVAAKDRTGGTEDTIKKAEKMDKKIILVPSIEGEDDPEYMLI